MEKYGTTHMEVKHFCTNDNQNHPVPPGYCENASLEI